MKNRSSRKKALRSKPSFHFNYIRYIVVISVIAVIGLIGIIAHKQNTRVLGVNTYLADENSQTNNKLETGDKTTSNKEVSNQEKPDKVEPTDRPEPTDMPEKKQEVEKVQNEINNQVEKNTVENIEVQAPSEVSQSGKVILQKSEGKTQELKTPLSNSTPVTQITTQNSGTVSVRIGGANTMTINNGPYTISTQFPVVINPKDQTMAIRTPSGITLIKTFPTEVFQNIAPSNKITSISSLTLTSQQGTPVYQANGIQIRKFLGIIPVQAQVKEDISAETGQVIRSELPWYFSLFGFAFQSI